MYFKRLLSREFLSLYCDFLLRDAELALMLMDFLADEAKQRAFWDVWTKKFLKQLKIGLEHLIPIRDIKRKAHAVDCLEARFEFTGCKIALICEGQILTILYDDKETIPYPNIICQWWSGRKWDTFWVCEVRFMRNWIFNCRAGSDMVRDLSWHLGCRRNSSFSWQI